MKKIILVLFFAGLIAPSFMSAQTVYLNEDFNAGWPTGWTTIDNDGLIPNAGVAVFTDAWIILEGSIAGDSVAASNSWYTPAGQADDYMITPQIMIGASVGVSWDAQAVDPSFPDGYELRISTTTPDVAGFMANPALYSIGNASPTLTNITVNLAAAGYMNQNIYLAWRNNSNDQYILFIDNIVVEDLAAFDAGVASVSLPDAEYTQIPLHQSPVFTLGGTLENFGGSAVTGARLTVDVKRNGIVVFTDTSAAAAIAIGATSAASFANYTPTEIGSYSIEYSSSIAETDSDPANNNLTATIEVTDEVYARDNDIQTGGLSIGAGSPGELGQNFTFNSQANINSVSVFLINTDDAMVGQPVSAKVYFFNAVPSAEVATTNIVTVTQSGPHWVDLPLATPLTLPAGTFSFIAQEGDSALQIGTTTDIFTPGAGWVIFGANPWDNSEAYGFSVAYMLRVNASKFCPINVAFTNVTDNACPDNVDGAIDITVTGGVAPYTYLWNTGATTEDLSGLAVGSYSGTVTDSEGCTVDIPAVDVNSTDTLPDGSITFDIQGGQIGFNANSSNGSTYSWDFGDASAPKTGATVEHTYANNGSYTVTVQVTNDCGTSTFTETVNMETVGLAEDLKKNVTIAPNPNQGVFNINFEDLKLKDATISVYTMTGQKIFVEKLDPIVSSYSHKVNLGTNLAQGVYILEIETEKIKTRKRFNIN